MNKTWRITIAFSFICMLILLLVHVDVVSAPALPENGAEWPSGVRPPYTNITIIDKPVKITELRYELVRSYSKLHYGSAVTDIVPQAIVIHWTASGTLESVYSYFFEERTSNPFHRKQGELNVCSQFVVDRDGTIYRLSPETMLNRHAIGLN